MMPIAETTRRSALTFVAGAAGGIGIRSAVAAETTSLPQNAGIVTASRPLAQILQQDITRTPFGYGARGDALGDDGPALRLAISSYGRPGGAIALSKAHFKVGAQGGAVLTLEAPIVLYGQGASLSVINPSLAGDADDTIVLSPTVDFSHDGLVLRDFGLLNPDSGERRGRRGIFLATDRPGQQLAGVWLENLLIGVGTGAGAWGVHHRNGVGGQPRSNVNGGWYGGGIRRCLIKGGIFLENSGDSLHIDDNILSGPGRSLTVALIAGASCLTVRGNNMTSAGGAINHISGHRCTYADNNIEHRTVGIAADTDGHRAVVVFSGDNRPGVANRLIGGLVSCFGSSDANVLVKIKNQIGFVIDGVTLLSGLKGTTTVYVDKSSKDTIIGQLIGQDVNGDGILDVLIVDHGVGTMGVTKTAALQSGWSVAGGKDDALQYRKSSGGQVHLWGSVTSAAITRDADVTILPPGFRPSRTFQSAVMVLGSTGATTMGRVIISPDGTVGITHVSGLIDTVVIDVCFEALNAGSAATFE